MLYLPEEERDGTRTAGGMVAARNAARGRVQARTAAIRPPAPTVHRVPAPAGGAASPYAAPSPVANRPAYTGATDANGDIARPANAPAQPQVTPFDGVRPVTYGAGAADPYQSQLQEILKTMSQPARMPQYSAGTGSDYRGAVVSPGLHNGYVEEVAGLVRGVDLGNEPDLGGTDLTDGRALLASARGRIGSTAATRARELMMKNLEDVSGGVDRGGLAKQALELFDEDNDRRRDEGLQAVLRTAAAGGRMGAQMTTSQGGDVVTEAGRSRDRMKKELALEVARETMSDRIARLNAASGVGGQLRGEDLAEAGMEQALSSAFTDLSRIERGDAVEDRDYRTTARARAADLAFRKAGELSALDQTQYARSGAERDELRGERSWQTSRTDAAQDRRIQQYEMEQGASAQNYQQQLQLIQMLMNGAQMGDPTDILLAAGQGGAGADVSPLIAAAGRRAGAR